MILQTFQDVIANSGWKLLALVASSLLLCLAPQSLVLSAVVARVRRWTKGHVAREAKLEQLVDRRRTSSGLTEEGEDPPEAKP